MTTRKCNWCKKEKPETQTKTVSLTRDGNSKRIYCKTCVFDEQNINLHGYKHLFKKKAREKEVELSKKEQERQGRRYGVTEIPPKTKKYE